MIYDSPITVALDHGLHWGAMEGFEDPETTLSSVLAAEPDGILASEPFVRRFGDRIDDSGVDVIVTLDVLYDSTMPADHENAEIHTRAFDPTAIPADADAAKVALVYGREDSDVLERNVEFVVEAVQACRDADVSLVVEPTMWGSRAEDEFDADYLAHANRLAFELGADVLKSPYPGDGFEPIVENAPVPLYIAGGPAVERDREVLRMVRNAVDAGAEGVMFGRNVWQRDDPAAIVEALQAVVRDGASVDEAARHVSD